MGLRIREIDSHPLGAQNPFLIYLYVDDSDLMDWICVTHGILETKIISEAKLPKDKHDLYTSMNEYYEHLFETFDQLTANMGNVLQLNPLIETGLNEYVW